jgi:hypothetical protein
VRERRRTGGPAVRRGRTSPRRSTHVRADPGDPDRQHHVAAGTTSSSGTSRRARRSSSRHMTTRCAPWSSTLTASATQRLPSSTPRPRDNESRPRNPRSRKRSGGEAKPRRVEYGGVERGKDDAVDGQGREVVARLLLELGWRARRAEPRALSEPRAAPFDRAEVRSLPCPPCRAQLTPLRFLERSAEGVPREGGDRRR